MNATKRRKIVGRKRIIAVIDQAPLLRECVSAFLLREFCGFDVMQLESADLLASSVAPGDVALAMLGAPTENVAMANEALEILETALPSVPVIILGDGELRARAAGLRGGKGVRGFLSCSTSPDIAVATIRIVLAGGFCLPVSDLRDAPSVSANSNLPVANDSCAEPLDELTPRELQVLEILAQGASNKAIANRLHLSDNTVKVHIRQIMRKLAVDNRTQAAIAARGRLDYLSNRIDNAS